MIQLSYCYFKQLKDIDSIKQQLQNENEINSTRSWKFALEKMSGKLTDQCQII